MITPSAISPTCAACSGVPDAEADGDRHVRGRPHALDDLAELGRQRGRARR